MSIKYNKADFLKKTLPIESMSNEVMSSLYLNILNYVNNNILDVNNMNTSMLEALDESASIYKDSKRTVSELTNSLSNVFVVGGESKDSIDIFNEEINIEENGLIIDYDTRKIHLKRTPSVIYPLSVIDINSRNGELGNTTGDIKRYSDINNIVGTSSRLEIESFIDRVDIDIDLDLKNESIMNNVKFKLINFGVRYPVIDSISISNDGYTFKKIKILTSNSFSLDVNNFDFKNGDINIHTEDFTAKYLKINIIQSVAYNANESVKRYAIGINSLEAGFFSSVESGNLIVGPIKNKDEIYKIAIASEVEGYSHEEKNVHLSISIDKETWVPIENSSIFDSSSELSKIVNFNNIDSSSLFTENPVMAFFLKIEMTSYDVSYLMPDLLNIDRQILNASSQNRTFIINNSDYQLLNLYRHEDLVYGDKILTEPLGGNTHSFPNKNICYIESDSKSILPGLGIESENSFNLLKNKVFSMNRGMEIQYSFDKIQVKRNDVIENIPSNDYDPFLIEIYSMSSVIDEEISIVSDNEESISEDYMPVIPFSRNAGTYKIRFDNESANINCKNGFFFDVRETIFIVPENTISITLEDEIGNIVGELTKEIVNNTTYVSVLELLDLTISSPGGLIFNSSYPIKELEKNEYTILFGKILFGNYYKNPFPLSRVMKSTIETSVDNNTKGVKLLSEESKQIKAEYKLEEYDLDTIIKLKHTNILEQSISFDLKDASINAFVKEVPFINGEDEFIIKNKYIDNVERNSYTIELHDNFIDDNKLRIIMTNTESGNVLKRRVYSSQELIDSGDFYIDKNLIPNTIIFPPGDSTCDCADTVLEYSIKPDKRSTSGFYSVDYINGILYTTSNIDGKTNILYMYSNVYAKYSALIESLSSDYSVSGNSITINTEDDFLKKYLLISSNKKNINIDFLATPILMDFNLNIIDERSSI